MTLDAMDWVWKHSQSKGNTRTALLYIADQVRTAACEVRLGQREIVRAVNTSKGTVETAIKKAVALGELEIAEPAAGRRGPLYRLPKAVGYARSTQDCAPISRAQEDVASAPISRAQDSGSAPISRAQGDSTSAPISRAQEEVCAPIFERLRPENPGTYPYPSQLASQLAEDQGAAPAPASQAYGIPEEARPLVDGLTAADVVVRWPFKGSGWFPVLALIKKAGVPAMVNHAVKAAKRADVQSASYFMRGWGELPPAVQTPPPPTAEIPSHCGDIDCDPVSRQREREDENGLRINYRCPECHPDNVRSHAA